MSDCGACGCPEWECLDLTLSDCDGMPSECCADCGHTPARTDADYSDPNQCPYCFTDECEWWKAVLVEARNTAPASERSAPTPTEPKANYPHPANRRLEP